jgi:hypothetical protein
MPLYRSLVQFRIRCNAIAIALMTKSFTELVERLLSCPWVPQRYLLARRGGSVSQSIVR